MTRLNCGNDVVCRALGGDIAGDTGTTTSAPTATAMADTGKAWTVDQWIGHEVVIGGTYGVITTNTATGATVDRWYVPGTPGGTAAATPSTGVYTILPGQAPAWYMALTADVVVPAVTDTTLPGEITTAAGGLKRKIAAIAHTVGTSLVTATGAFTANPSDVLPVTVHKLGDFQFLTPATGKPVFETVLTADATLSAAGDPLTITHSITV